MQAAGLLLLSRRSRQTIAAHGALAGFTPAVWLITALTAGGGLLIAAVVKHADNVLKTFATALAIVATCAATVLRTGVPPTAAFLRGFALVCTSMYLYNSGGAPAAGPAADGVGLARGEAGGENEADAAER